MYFFGPGNKSFKKSIILRKVYIRKLLLRFAMLRSKVLQTNEIIMKISNLRVTDTKVIE